VNNSSKADMDDVVLCKSLPSVLVNSDLNIYYLPVAGAVLSAQAKTTKSA